MRVLLILVEFYIQPRITSFCWTVSPAELQYILSTNMNNYVKGKLAKSFDEIIGQTAFTTDGEAWRFHRKITVGILNRDAVQYTATIMNEKLRRLESYLKAKDGQVVDFQDVSYKLIMDVLLRWAFGLEVDQFGHDDAATVKEADSVDDKQDKRQGSLNVKDMEKIIDAFDKLQLYTHQRFNDLFWQIKQQFCIGERERNVKECTRIMDDFCLDLIQETRNHHKDEAAGESREDVISRFLRYAEKESVPCTDKMLRDFCMQFLLAGRDSTAAALAWCLYELTKHPNWILSLREEVDGICGPFHSNNSESFTIETVQKMKVVHAIVNETLRLHSPAPDNYRFAVKDDILPDDTEIPAGSLVMFSPYTINHSEKVWGPNADDFDPSRWMDMGEPSPSRFPTFGVGSRLCPGRNLGLMEVKLALAFLVSKFDFIDEMKHNGDYAWRLVMSMKGGFPVRVASRKS
jgi:cytochrome P450